MGHSFPITNDGRLFERCVSYNGQSWGGYAANASPAQAVQHGIIELADRTPDLVVSGINFGENVGAGITGSGTVGAAIEAAALNIPALAVSLETDFALHHNHDDSVDFTAALHFTRLFAERWLNGERLANVDILKIDIPASATPETPWRMTRLERSRYFIPLPPLRRNLGDVGRLGYTVDRDAPIDPQSDAAAIREGVVAVTPLCIDLTAAITAADLDRVMNGDA